MNFLIKAFAQNLISLFPRSERVNYLFQKHVSRSLPARYDQFLKKLEIADKHLAIFERYSPYMERASAQFYEFGAGWDLIGPIAFYSSGILSQVVIDIRPNLRLELVNDTISKMQTLKQTVENAYDDMSGKSIQHMYAVRSMNDLLNEYGIKWLANVDAKSTGFESSSVDFISNTATFEHIPADQVADVFKECYRILKNGGTMSCLIDLKDHYAGFDSRISIYNFLKYPDWIWDRVNSRIAFQNRLRSKDYIQMVANRTRFEIARVEEEEPEVEDLKILESMRLENRFEKHYSFKELGVKACWLVLKK